MNNLGGILPWLKPPCTFPFYRRCVLGFSGVALNKINNRVDLLC